MNRYIDVEPLKAKIKSLAEEITRLLAENKELKKRFRVLPHRNRYLRYGISQTCRTE